MLPHLMNVWLARLCPLSATTFRQRRTIQLLGVYMSGFGLDKGKLRTARRDKTSVGGRKRISRNRLSGFSGVQGASRGEAASRGGGPGSEPAGDARPRKKNSRKKKNSRFYERSKY